MPKPRTIWLVMIVSPRGVRLDTEESLDTHVIGGGKPGKRDEQPVRALARKAWLLERASQPLSKCPSVRNGVGRSVDAGKLNSQP